MKKLVMFVFCLWIIPIPTHVYSEAMPQLSPPPGMSYTFNDEFEVGQMHYFAGYERNLENNETDALFIGYDESNGHTQFVFTYEIGYDEEFVYIAYLGNNKVAVVSRNTVVASLYSYREFINLQVLIFSCDGSFLEKDTFEIDYTEFGNVGDKLFLAKSGSTIEIDEYLNSQAISTEPQVYEGSISLFYRGSAWINQHPVESIELTLPGNYLIEIVDKQFSYEMHLVLYPFVSGLPDQNGSTEPVMIESLGNLFVNGESYLSSTEITIPGNYTLSINGEGGFTQEYQFVIYPTILGVIDNEITEDSVIVETNAISMMLDGIAYTKEEIYKPGVYNLVLLGVNGFSQSIEFTILPSVYGVENQGVYDSSVSISVNGIAYLNGVIMGEKMTLTKPGDYLIQIYFEDEVYKSVFFTVATVEGQSTTESNSTSIEYGYFIILGLLVLSGLFLIIRKK